MTASAWTQDRIDRLKRLWKEGQTAEQIAKDLANGISRNAVLGKVYRMGLSAGRVAAPPKARPGVSPPSTSRVAIPAAPIIAAPALGETPPGANLPVDRPQPPETGRASLLSVRRHECRWPLGEPGSQAFSLCGQPAVRGAYCGPHARIAYRPTPETSRSLERLAGLA
jgi:GcrA cell cycle regulator